jgi:hypothetical protein
MNVSGRLKLSFRFEGLEMSRRRAREEEHVEEEATTAHKLKLALLEACAGAQWLRWKPRCVKAPT